MAFSLVEALSRRGQLDRAGGEDAITEILKATPFTRPTPSITPTWWAEGVCPASPGGDACDHEGRLLGEIHG